MTSPIFGSWANNSWSYNLKIICPREYLGKSAIKSIYSSQPRWFHVSYHSHFCLNACKQCLLRWLKTSVHIFSSLASCISVQGNHTEQVFSRYRFGGGGQKPWWDANKKRFVTAQGAVLALDHHRHRHGDRIPGSLTLSDTIFFSSWLLICLKTAMHSLLVL